MRVGQFLKVMGVVTFMAVFYIHLQMNIYALAYQGKVKEQKIEKLAENNRMVQNDILRLRSSDHIGRQLLAKEKDYRFAGKNRVVEVEDRGSSWTNPIAMNKGAQGLGRFMTIAFSPAQPMVAK